MMLNTKHAQELWERLPNTGETIASQSSQQAIRLIEHALRDAEQRGRREALAVARLVLNDVLNQLSPTDFYSRTQFEGVVNQWWRQSREHEVANAKEPHG